jgi:hypothetical protein
MHVLRAHLGAKTGAAMQATLAFAPQAHDLEEDFFGVPIIVWAPPDSGGEDDDETPAAA